MTVTLFPERLHPVTETVGETSEFARNQTAALGIVYGLFLHAPATAGAHKIRFNADGAAVVTYHGQEGTKGADRALDALTAWEQHLTDPARSETHTKAGSLLAQVHGTVGPVWIVVQADIGPADPVAGDPGDWLDGVAL